jgi:hypothetical protein
VKPRPVQRAIVRPADGLLHPIPLLALATLVLNDQVLKASRPRPAGMTFETNAAEPIVPRTRACFSPPIASI